MVVGHYAEALAGHGDALAFLARRRIEPPGGARGVPGRVRGPDVGLPDPALADRGGGAGPGPVAGPGRDQDQRA